MLKQSTYLFRVPLEKTTGIPAGCFNFIKFTNNSSPFRPAEVYKEIQKLYLTEKYLTNHKTNRGCAKWNQVQPIKIIAACLNSHFSDNVCKRSYILHQVMMVSLFARPKLYPRSPWRSSSDLLSRSVNVQSRCWTHQHMKAVFGHSLCAGSMTEVDQLKWASLWAPVLPEDHWT